MQDRKMFITEDSFTAYCESMVTDKYVFNRVGKQVADFHIDNNILPLFIGENIQDLACIFTIGA